MPKIIADVKQQLLAVANRMITEEGYEKLSVRAIAKECNIATGTIYNYFKNKEELFVGVILEGWQRYLTKMDERCKDSGDFAEGLEGICLCIEEFIQEYQAIWLKFGTAGMNYSSLSPYHKMLRNQIKERVLKCAKIHSVEIDDVADLLAEMILAAAIQRDINEKDVSRLVHRIITQ